jgi:hypothetical protein
MESAAYRSMDCTTDKAYSRTALADVLDPSKKKWARAGNWRAPFACPACGGHYGPIKDLASRPFFDLPPEKLEGKLRPQPWTLHVDGFLTLNEVRVPRFPRTSFDKPQG